MSANVDRDDLGDSTATAGVFGSFCKVPPDATLLLEQDHRAVEACFAQYERLEDPESRRALRQKILMLLKAHMQMEEEIVYPEARLATERDDMVDHAIEEHTDAKRLMGAIEGALDGPDVDEMVESLRRAIEKHVREEEDEFFPEIRKSDLALYEIGAAIAALRADMLRDLKSSALIQSALA